MCWLTCTGPTKRTGLQGDDGSSTSARKRTDNTHGKAQPNTSTPVPSFFFISCSATMAQSLVPSAQFSTYHRPSNTTYLPSQSYVLHLASLPGHYAAVSSAPTNTIDIYDKSSLRHIQTLPGHETATTSLKTIDSVAGFTRQSLVSSGHDGSVKIWDDRSNSHSIKSEYHLLFISLKVLTA